MMHKNGGFIDTCLFPTETARIRSMKAASFCCRGFFFDRKQVFSTFLCEKFGRTVDNE